MLSCDFCGGRRKTTHTCYHCLKPLCQRCSVVTVRGGRKPARLELGKLDRVCAGCLMEHRRAHGLSRREAALIIRFCREAPVSER